MRKLGDKVKDVPLSLLEHSSDLLRNKRGLSPWASSARTPYQTERNANGLDGTSLLAQNGSVVHASSVLYWDIWEIIPDLMAPDFT